MSTDKKSVRSHSKEREWLENLGKGDLVQGVRSLVAEAQEKESNSTTASSNKQSSKK